MTINTHFKLHWYPSSVYFLTIQNKQHNIIYYVSPMYTEGETCWFTSVLSAPSVSVCVSVFSIQFCSTLSLMQAVKHETLTQCWANNNPASVQNIMPVPTASQYRQHEVLTRAERILASKSNEGPTFSRHRVSVGWYTPPAVSTIRPAS